MPNPALALHNRAWLNARLMARAIPKPPRLECVVERRAVGNSLGLHPQRSRSEQREDAFPEGAVRAGIAYRRRRRAVSNDVPGAVSAAMLELGERFDLADAQLDRRRSRPADFPLARLRRRQHRGRRSSGENRQDANSCDSPRLSSESVHAQQFNTNRLPQNDQDTSSSANAKLCEQNSQSTRIIPSFPAMASRSSAGNRAMTERT